MGRFSKHADVRLLTALILLAMTATSRAVCFDVASSGRSGSVAAVVSRVAADHPPLNGATVSRESFVRTQGLHEPTLSSFTIDLAPGGSAILHGGPTPGYVLVHVVSGAIEARAWRARLGSYRAGETWIEPAFAHDITAANASTAEAARAFVVVVVP